MRDPQIVAQSLIHALRNEILGWSESELCT